MNELALFAGAGGGILGGKLLGWRTRCAVEIDAYARRVLFARQRDGMLEPFPIWDDVSTFDGKPWHGAIDIITGGFPCQDISAAGKGKGLAGERSGLWSEMARIIGEVGPRFVLVENSPLLVSRGLGRVLGDLAQMGYDAEWGVVGAHHAGAPHRRDRIWILAHAIGTRFKAQRLCNFGCWQGKKTCIRSGTVSYPMQPRIRRIMGDKTMEENIKFSDSLGIKLQKTGPFKQLSRFEHNNWWNAEPELGRVAHGVANRVDRIKCIGNGQVPAVVRLAWETLIGRI